jgi:hypothetical protein
MKKYFLDKRYHLFLALIFSIILLLSFRTNNIYSERQYKDIGDTTGFSPNATQGWGIYTSFIENLGDSIEFELILFRNVPAGNNWNDTLEVGTIKTSYTPIADRIIEYLEQPRTWRIIFLTNGKCFFQLLSGPVPEGSQIIIPVITKYKK